MNLAVDYISTSLNINTLIERYNSLGLAKTNAITISLYKSLSKIFISLKKEVYFSKLLLRD